MGEDIRQADGHCSDVRSSGIFDVLYDFRETRSQYAHACGGFRHGCVLERIPIPYAR